MPESLLALAGVAVGSALSFVSARSHVGRSDQLARRERLRQARQDAYTQFAGAVVEYRRTMVDLRLSMLRGSDEDALDKTSMRNARAGAWQAYYGVRLLALGTQEHEPGRALLTKIGDLKSSASPEDESDSLKWPHLGPGGF